jgi:hypothetical protein
VISALARSRAVSGSDGVPRAPLSLACRLAGWPLSAASMLGAAERSGAVLVNLSGLHGYGPAFRSLGVNAYDQSHPMTEATPLAAMGRMGRVRARVWQDALGTHQTWRL